MSRHVKKIYSKKDVTRRAGSTSPTAIGDIWTQDMGFQWPSAGAPLRSAGGGSLSPTASWPRRLTAVGDLE